MGDWLDVGDDEGDFHRCAAEGHQRVALRATHDATTWPPTFRRRVQAAAGAGLTVAAYHECDGENVEAQLAAFLAAVAPVRPLLALLCVRGDGDFPVRFLAALQERDGAVPARIPKPAGVDHIVQLDEET